MSDEGCTLTHRAEGIPGQPFSPAPQMTTPSSVTHELSGGTALQLPSGEAANSVAGNGYSHHFAIQMDDDHDLESGGQNSATIISSRTATSIATGPAGLPHVTSGISITGTSSGLPIANSIAVQLFKVGNTFLGLGFQAAVSLWIFRLQPLGDSTPWTFLFNLVGATIVVGFTLTLIGMLLRKFHSTAANISSCAGILSFVLGFFLMMGMYVAER